MFLVSKGFIDLQDDNHEYEIGDVYPREGYKPDEVRILTLASDKNLQGVPLIKEVKEAVTEDAETVPEEVESDGGDEASR